MTVNEDKSVPSHNRFTYLQKFQQQKYLIYSLLASGFAILVAEQFGKEFATLFTDWIYLPVPAALVILSIILIKRQGLRGNHGIAWISFAVMSASWFIAEQVWSFNEIFLHTKPFPSDADIFYLAGYPAYFVFSVLYLKPVRKAISKKMIIGACLISAVVLIPNLYMTFGNNSGEDQFAIALGATYPVADAIILVPAILGVALFMGGKVNFLWTLMVVAVLLNVGADTAFQYFSLDNSYYTGHPVDIIYLWAYIVFSFGVYDYIKIFRKEKKEERFFDQEKMR